MYLCVTQPTHTPRTEGLSGFGTQMLTCMIPAWQWPKTHGQGNKGESQDEAH